MHVQNSRNFYLQQEQPRERFILARLLDQSLTNSETSTKSCIDKFNYH